MFHWAPLCFRVWDAEMEEDRGVLLATERYGSAEAWRYFGKDGEMDRRREGGGEGIRGNPIVAVFKVRVYDVTFVATLTGNTLTVWPFISECVSAPRLPGECQQRLPAVPAVGHSAGTVNDFQTTEVVSHWTETVRPRSPPFSVSQAFSSSLSGTLATQASLRGVGVGNQEATVAAATITWLLKGDPPKWSTHLGSYRSHLVNDAWDVFLLQMGRECWEESSLLGGKGTF